MKKIACLALVSWLAACGTPPSSPSLDSGAADAAIDPITATCETNVHFPNRCSDACALNHQSAFAACSAQVTTLMSQSDLSTFQACTSNCSAERTCPSQTLIDCACGTACARARSSAFQAAMDAYVSCAAAQPYPGCQ